MFFREKSIDITQKAVYIVNNTEMCDAFHGSIKLLVTLLYTEYRELQQQDIEKGGLYVLHIRKTA